VLNKPGRARELAMGIALLREGEARGRNPSSWHGSHEPTLHRVRAGGRSPLSWRALVATWQTILVAGQRQAAPRS